jgi:hypothetical protein
LGSGDIAPRILDLGTRMRWVVSFTLQPLFPQVESTVPISKQLSNVTDN